jgi:hypothetical protein
VQCSAKRQRLSRVHKASPSATSARFPVHNGFRNHVQHRLELINAMRHAAPRRATPRHATPRHASLAFVSSVLTVAGCHLRKLTFQSSHASSCSHPSECATNLRANDEIAAGGVTRPLPVVLPTATSVPSEGAGIVIVCTHTSAPRTPTRTHVCTYAHAQSG